MSRGFPIFVLALAMLLCSQTKLADAAIYWTERPSIGRVNLDGSYPEPGFIAEMGPPNIYGACGVAVSSAHIFWADSGRGAIGRARLDGTERNYEFISGASDPCGVAVTDSHVFWANRRVFEGAGSIGRARLDGTEVDQSFVDTEGVPCGVVANESHLLWASYYNDAIGRADIDGGSPDIHFIEEADGACGIALGGPFLYGGTYGESIGRARIDGSEPIPQFITGLERPCGVALYDGRLYWTEQGPFARSLGQADLDGTDVNRAVVTGLIDPCGVAVDGLTLQPPPPPPPEQPTVCSFRGATHDRSAGTATVGIRAPLHGTIRLLTPGLTWLRLPITAPSGQRVWWTMRFRIGVSARGRAGARLRWRLARTGRVSVRLRVRCDGVEESSTTGSRRLRLFQTDHDRKPRSGRRGQR